MLTDALQTFSDQDLPKDLRHRVIFAGARFNQNWYEDRLVVLSDILTANQ